MTAEPRPPNLLCLVSIARYLLESALAYPMGDSLKKRLANVVTALNLILDVETKEEHGPRPLC